MNNKLRSLNYFADALDKHLEKVNHEVLNLEQMHKLI